jgi:hypothetical protein
MGKYMKNKGNPSVGKTGLTNSAFNYFYDFDDRGNFPDTLDVVESYIS